MKKWITQFLVSAAIIFLAVASTTIPGFAADPVPLTGVFRTASNGLFNGSIVFRLPFAGATDTITGALVSPGLVRFPIVNGALPANAQLTPNTIINPFGTYYLAALYDQSGAILSIHNVYISSNSSPFNVTAALASTITTNQVSYWNPTALNSSSVTIFDLTIGTAYSSYGDSITACFGVIITSNCYINQIATTKKWANTNFGISGTGITDAGQADSIFATTIAPSSISTELCCVNDMRNNAGAGILGTAQQVDWQSSLEAALLWLAVPDTSKIKASGAGITYAGTWGATGPYAAQLYGATTNGATATFSVYGTSVYVVSLWQTSNTSTYSVTVDGTTYPTISTSTGAYTTALGRTYGPLVSRFSGLTERAHTVVVTCVSCNGSNPAYFFFAASGTGAPTKYGPYVFIGNTLRFTSAGYASFGGSDAIVAQFNQRIKQIQDDLASDGMHVVMVDASGYYTPGGANTQADGVHPTDAGHLIIGAAFLNELTSFLEPKDRAALQVLQNINPCTINGVWIIGGCVTGAPSGAIGSVTGPTSGTIYVGGDGAGLQRTGGSYLWSSPGSPFLLQFGGITAAFPGFSFTATPPKVRVVAADNSADAAFEALTYVLNGGITITGQTGTGVNWVTDVAPTISSPKLTVGMCGASSTACQHKRVASCTTGAVALNNCNTTVTWNNAFADANYTATCTADQLNAIGHISHSGSKLAGSIVVSLVTDTAVAISGTINCIAMHD